MKVIAILMVITALLLVGCATEAPEKQIEFPTQDDEGSAVMASGNNYQVAIEGYEFMPSTVEVRAGDTVEWVNVHFTQVENEDYTEGVDHTVTFDNGMFDQVLPAGTTVSYTFTEPGVYNYVCSFHPQMQGIVVVN
ncbi:MAG: plastocyanin/azurin family copper-binding protein [Candidatus Woesearchaeota archaeon]